MASLVELLMRLERRLIAVENALGITAGKDTLMHPKSLTQAQSQASKPKETK